jgi:hypothetical protein
MNFKEEDMIEDEPNKVDCPKTEDEKKEHFYKHLELYKSLFQKLQKVENLSQSPSSIIPDIEIMRTRLKDIHAIISHIEHINCYLTHSENKMIHNLIKTLFTNLLNFTKMHETKISLQVSRSALPSNYNYHKDPNFPEIKLVYAPLVKIIHKCLELTKEWGENPVIDDCIILCNFVLNFN